MHLKIMNSKNWLFAALTMTLIPSALFAEDAYYHLPINSLNFTEGALPARGEPANYRHWQTWPALQPYAVLDGGGEVYLDGESFTPWTPGDRQNHSIAIRALQGKDVTGRLFVPKPDGSGMTLLKFKIDSAKAKAESRVEFLKAKEN